MIEILNRFTKAAIYRSETAMIFRDAVIEAMGICADLTRANLTRAKLSRANLTRANLTRADLSGAKLSGAKLSRANLTRANLTRANLTRADLSGAKLSDADLSGAKLSGAKLSGAKLSGAKLSGADLSGADLSRADLSGADLTRANLTRADLTRADLSGADLSGADLSDAENDFYVVLSHTPGEAAALISAIENGKVNGSVYTDGECGCLIGTLAMAAGASPTSRCDVVHGISGNAFRPIERLFTAINKGDTPQNNQIAKIIYGWATQWLSRMQAAFGERKESDEQIA